MHNINQLVNLIYKKRFEKQYCEMKYDDYIIVGDNMSGKSELIRELENKIEDQLFFIDTVNRTIGTTDPIGEFDKITSVKEIVEERFRDERFNISDSIGIYNHNLILNELIEHYDKYQLVIESYIGKSFQILEQKEASSIMSGNIVYKYKIGDKIYDSLSNGEQAIIRILVEIMFAISRGVSIIAIDEIDLYLDSTNCKKMIKFLKEKFSSVNWIITTHSDNIIFASENFNIIKIKNGQCSYYDSNDFDNIPYINRILFEPSIFNESEIDVKLSDLIRRRVLGVIISQEEIYEVKKLDSLTVRQEILKKYILGWENEN